MNAEKKLNQLPNWRWMETFLNEKEYDMESCLYEAEGEWGLNIIEGGHMIHTLSCAPALERKKIKETLVKIDFMNGSIHHFFSHLAQALAM